MDKYKYDEINGLWYELKGTIISPASPCRKNDDRSIDIWGQHHKRYLQEQRKIIYTQLLTSGRLNSYLAKINQQAQERMEQRVAEIKSLPFLFTSYSYQIYY